MALLCKSRTTFLEKWATSVHKGLGLEGGRHDHLRFVGVLDILTETVQLPFWFVTLEWTYPPLPVYICSDNIVIEHPSF